MLAFGKLLQVPLFDFFDEWFSKHVAPRHDVKLDVTGEAADPPFPSAAAVAILRTSGESCLTSRSPP